MSLWWVKTSATNFGIDTGEIDERQVYSDGYTEDNNSLKSWRRALTLSKHSIFVPSSQDV